MRARQIEVFRTVMRCGSITAAARALNVSQPALSQILLHTEDELGFRLFDRTGGRLVPTPEAVELFPDADRLFLDLETLRHQAAELRGGRIGTVRLAASTPPSLSIVPRALRSFRAAHPGVRLLSYVVPVATMTVMLDRGQVGIGMALSDEAYPAIETEQVGQCRIVCLLPDHHTLAASAAVSAADLAGETLISYRPTSLPGRLLAAAMAQAGATLRPDIEIDVSVVAPAFVQSGLGIALVDGLLPWAQFPGLVARPFSPAVSLPLCLLTSRRRPLSRHHLALRDALRASAAAHLPGSP